jgi:hypothetical protein
LLAITSIVGEIPTKVTTAPNIWSLKYKPLPKSLACYRNGVRQTKDIDYSIEGKKIITIYWTSEDILVCDYLY